MQHEKTSQASPQDAGGQLHQAPSMLWFAVPLGLLLLYAVPSR
jgi:hypothetical protein